MAYVSYDELIDDANHDPKLAKMRVAKAKQEGIPVVSKDNSGYRSKAISARMGANTAGKKPKYTDSVIKNRMKNSQKPAATEDDEAEQIAAKRKKVGY